MVTTSMKAETSRLCCMDQIIINGIIIHKAAKITRCLAKNTHLKRSKKCPLIIGMFLAQKIRKQKQ